MPFVGDAPLDLGLVEIADGEMLFAMYLPISIPGMTVYQLPDNLKRFAPLVSEVKQHAPADFLERYVYLTAKTLWVGGDYIGNRPGWHTDGFGTDDINYIWSDRAPTEFLIAEEPLTVSDNCDHSMVQMEDFAWFPLRYRTSVVEYADRHLLRLDPKVVHRSPEHFEGGLRTFAKVSLSHDRYDLKGNAVNPHLPETHWPLVARHEVRNHPSSEKNS